jgi:thiamine kinase-like enzyme
MEKTILDDVKRILKTENVSIIERLMGGMSNYTYVVNAAGKKFTYRLPGEYADFFVDRVQEKENIRMIETLGITNRTLYLNIKDGCKLAEYVEGKPLSTLTDYPYEKVAEILKKIHNSNLKAASDYEPFHRLKNYELIVKELGFIHPFRYLKLRASFNHHQKFLENQHKVFTHGDSQPSNFVYDGERLLVVDFEFSGNNDPIYDIACFANIRYEEGFKLLNVYYDEPSKEEILRFNLWRCFQCFQWFNVAMFKEMKGMSKSLKINFGKVAEQYLDLAEMLLNKVS